MKWPRMIVGFSLLVATGTKVQAGMTPILPVIATPWLTAATEEPLDAAALADRITRNAREAGERLAQGESGTPTRTAQQQVLHDIDELLKQAQEPPPMPPPMGSPPPDSGTPPPPSAGSPNAGPPPPTNGAPSDASPSKPDNPMARPMGTPTANNGEEAAPPSRPEGRRDRNATANPEPSPTGQASQPMTAKPNEKSSQENASKPSSDGSDGGRTAKTIPALPAEDPREKGVWGHLPERVRQQLTQYYREEFQGPYAELLREYYSNLAAREQGTKR